MIDVKFDQSLLIRAIQDGAESHLESIRETKINEINRLFESSKESFSLVKIHIENTKTNEKRKISFGLEPSISFNNDPDKIIASITFPEPEDSILFYAQNEGAGLTGTIGDTVLEAINTILKKSGKKEIQREKDVEIYLEPSKAFQKFITAIQVDVSGVKKSIGNV